MLFSLRMLVCWGLLLHATFLGFGQTTPAARSDTLMLGTEVVSPSIEESERAFFAQMDAHNQRLLHLTDSLQTLLHPQDGSSSSLSEKEKQELQQCLKMYEEMLETNQRLIRGQGRIKATF